MVRYVVLHAGSSPAELVEGLRLFAKKRFRESAAQLQAADNKRRLRGTALAALVESLFGTKQFKKAGELLPRLVADSAENPAGLRLAGRIATAFSDWQASQNIWEILKQHVPGDREATARLGEAQTHLSYESSLRSQRGKRQIKRGKPRRGEAVAGLGRRRIPAEDSKATSKFRAISSPPDPPSLIAAVYSAASRKDSLALASALARLARLGGEVQHVADLSSLFWPVIAKALSETFKEPDLTVDVFVLDLIELYRPPANDWFRQACHGPEAANLTKSVVRLADRHALPANPILLSDAIHAAAASKSVDAASTLAALLLNCDFRDARQMIAAGEKLRGLGLVDQTISVWQQVQRHCSVSMRLALAICKLLNLSGRFENILAELHFTLSNAPPPRALPSREQNYFVDLIRLAFQVLTQKPNLAPAVELDEALARLDDQSSALIAWARGFLQAGYFRLNAALEHLNEALARPPVPSGVLLNIHAEKAVLLARYYRFQEASEALQHVPPEDITQNDFYKRRVQIVLDFQNVCQVQGRQLIYPDSLVDAILNEVAQQPIGYEPIKRHVAMVSGSLGQGGGERQTATVVSKMSRDNRLSRLSLFVRSTQRRPNDDFFLAKIRELPLNLLIYGNDWTKSDVLSLVPEMSKRESLIQAIEQLPHDVREEVLRLVRLFLTHRPEVVHIWQDMYAAALACAIAGVPNFFIHRGSLSPDYWQQNEHQTAVHFSVMKYTFRKLIEFGKIVIANNSKAGCRSDQKWLAWPDAKPFKILYNAVDFTNLGPNIGANQALRRDLGIPRDAFVVGGSFRIFPVKRPLLWVEVAKQISDRFENTHFVIIGDGEMTKDVEDLASKLGIREKFHLPGRVSNVGDWYRIMDLMLLTSEREGIPNVIIEAQHFGVPVIATKVGGIAEAILPTETGFAVKGSSALDYSRAAIRVMSDKKWLSNVKSRAPVFIHDKFSLDKVVDRIIGKFYKFSTSSKQFE